MKNLVTTLVIILTTTSVMAVELNIVDIPGFFQPDPQFIKKEESASPVTDRITQIIQKKTVELEFNGYKVTDLGYGQLTPKVISLELAKHTALDHRNRGEEGPCLSAEVEWDENGMVIPEMTISLPVKAMVTIELRNSFLINTDKGVCQVFLEELVEVEIDGKKFDHHLSQDMGHRLIADCLISQ